AARRSPPPRVPHPCFSALASVRGGTAPGDRGRAENLTPGRGRAAGYRAALPREPPRALLARYGSSEPPGRARFSVAGSPALADGVAASAGGVYQAGVGVVRSSTGSSVVDEVVGCDRLAGEVQPPPLPLVG